VVGIPDPAGGDTIPRAFVVLKPEASGVTPEEIRSFVDDQVAVYKKLRGGLYILSRLPKNKTGKISKVDCMNIAISV